MNITFRKLAEKTDLEKLEELESAVWSESSVVPSHMTLTLAKFGGLFLGAFDGDRMIGFLYSFPGYTDQELHLCSHMLGFLPEYRKQGLGVQMKWMQRSEALAEGYRRITWTYDPLETVNAYLNLVKLGGVVHRYIPNCYGELADDMNRGLPTDRFYWIGISQATASCSTTPAKAFDLTPAGFRPSFSIRRKTVSCSQQEYIWINRRSACRFLFLRTSRPSNRRIWEQPLPGGKPRASCSLTTFPKGTS